MSGRINSYSPSFRKEEKAREARLQAAKADPQKKSTPTKTAHPQAKYVQGNKDLLKNIPQAKIQEMVSQAESKGSPVVDIPLEDGTVAHFVLAELKQAEAKNTSHLSNMKTSASTPTPEETPYFPKSSADNNKNPLVKQTRQSITSKLPSTAGQSQTTSHSNSVTSNELKTFSDNKLLLNELANDSLSETMRLSQKSKDNVRQMERDSKNYIKRLMFLINSGMIVEALRLYINNVKKTNIKINRSIAEKMQKLETIKVDLAKSLANVKIPKARANPTASQSAQFQNDMNTSKRNSDGLERSYGEVNSHLKNWTEMLADNKRGEADLSELLSSVKESDKREFAASVRA